MASRKNGRLSSLERVRRTLALEETDRTAYSLWTSFPGIDCDALSLTAKTVAFARRLDLDFVRTMPNEFFCVEDWRCAIIAEADRVRPSESRDALRAIHRLSLEAPSLARELDHIEQLVWFLGPETPVIAMTCSPLAILGKLVGPELPLMLDDEPDLAEAALEAIGRTMAEFNACAIGLGCAGVFFAGADGIAEATHHRFGAPYDAVALAGAAGGWFNIVRTKADAAYGGGGLMKACREADDFRDGRRPFVGGLSASSLAGGNLSAVATDIRRAKESTGGRGLFLSPDSAIEYPADIGFLATISALMKSGRRLQ